MGADAARLSGRIKAIIAAALLLAIAFIAVNIAAYRSGQRVLREQASFAAFALACDLVEKSVRSSGRWPASWEALPELPAAEVARLKDLIEIDFAADLAAVQRQQAGSLSAIRPRHPSVRFPVEPIAQSFLESLHRMNPR